MKVPSRAAPSGVTRQPGRRGRPSASPLLSALLAGAAVGLAPAATADATVTVSAVQDGRASEVGPTPGLFHFTRSGDTTQPLEVGFTLGGTAILGADYLHWETRADFSAGNANAFVTVLPRNDTLAEDTETVLLTLLPGPGYTLGSPSTATVHITDQHVQGLPGVFDNTLTDNAGVAMIAPDLTYLDAWLAEGSLHLVVGLVNASSLLNNLEIFLDTDQNPETGDWRPGHVAGQEFRVHASTGFLAGYDLYRLPTEPPANPQQVEQDTLVHSAPGSVLDGGVTYAIPLTRLGNPSAVDVFVATHIGAAQIQHRGIGDRLPKFGTLDTASRQVVVRRPARTGVTRLEDVAGDVNRLGFDLRSVELNVVADQFTLALSFSSSFDPTNPILFPGPAGEVLLDTDASLLTGAFPMGATIPTWGADYAFEYSLHTPSPVFLLVPYSSGQQVTFGQDRNDGRWFSPTGRELHFSGSLSVLDPVQLGSGFPSPRRVSTDGRMVLQTFTFNELGSLHRDGVADRAPDGARAFEAAGGRALDPLEWSEARTIASDPLDYPPPPVSGQDVTQVEAEIIRQHLVVKVTLSSWLATDTANLFRVAFDTDLDAATAPLGTLANGAGPAIGVDYDLRVTSVDVRTGPPAYAAFLGLPNGQTLRTDATVLAQPTLQSAQPGSFTVTLPLEVFTGVGAQRRLYVTTGRVEGGDRFDVAPLTPLVIDLATSGPTDAPRHPADDNPPDNRITLQELIAYAAAYKRGAAWPVGPNPIPLDYVIRAATLYKRGETYRYDPDAGEAPLWWVNPTPPRLSGAGAPGP